MPPGTPPLRAQSEISALCFEAHLRILPPPSCSCADPCATLIKLNFQDGIDTRRRAKAVFILRDDFKFTDGPPATSEPPTLPPPVVRARRHPRWRNSRKECRRRACPCTGLEDSESTRSTPRARFLRLRRSVGRTGRL